MSNSLSEKFVPDFFDQETSVEEVNEEVRTFDLEDVIEEDKQVKRSFEFDNEIQRNFDPSSVARAKEGVIEVFEDAMIRLKAQSTQLRQDAYQEGYDQGHQEGFKAGEEAAKVEFAPFLEVLQQLVQDLTDFRGKMFPKVEREMVEMIVGLARKVIHHELVSREDSVKDVIRLAVQSVLDREQMTIKIHPSDKTHAESYRPELHQLFNDIKNIIFEAHPSIERGGCVIETNFGRIDARVDQLHDQIDTILKLAPPPPAEEEFLQNEEETQPPAEEDTPPSPE